MYTVSCWRDTPGVWTRNWLLFNSMRMAGQKCWTFLRHQFTHAMSNEHDDNVGCWKYPPVHFCGAGTIWIVCPVSRELKCHQTSDKIWKLILDFKIDVQRKPLSLVLSFRQGDCWNCEPNKAHKSSDDALRQQILGPIWPVLEYLFLLVNLIFPWHQCRGDLPF